MKIAVNGKSLTTVNPGGAVRVGLNVVYHLASLVDWRFDLWLPDSQSAAVLPKMPENVRICFQPADRHRTAFAKFCWEQWHLPRLLNARDYDLVLNLINSCAVLRRVRAPQILLVHDSGFLVSGWFKKAFSVYLRLLIRLSVWRRCQIVTVSQTAATQLKQAFSSLDHIEVIPNGLDNPPENVIPYRPAYPYLLFLGSRNPRKNLKGMLEAFRYYCHKHPDDPHYLVIVGGAKDIFREVDTSQDEQRVEWLGYVGDEQKWSVLAGATGLILPSFLEGFGLPVGEALLLGKPVIASDIPVFHEIYGEAIDMYVDPHDTRDIAHGIERLLQNHRHSPAAAASRAEMLSRYHWPKVAAEYRDLCLRMAGRNQS